MRVYAFIFARGGSKGIKNKNLIKVKGKPLLTYSLSLAKKIRKIEKIFVSTDDKRISNLAKKYGAHIIKRPKKLASDKSNELESWKHAVRFLSEKKDKFDIFLSLPCTAPLRNKTDILNSLKKFSKSNVDMVVNITDANKNPYFNMVKVNKKNELNIINKNSKNFFRRQDVPKVFNLTTVAYATSPKYILNTKNLFNGKIIGNYVPIERSIDIDSKFDLKLAKFLIEKK